ncbi:hypothetical protein L486_00276 [Kwoniella mangroviensis CBS 10435]|uniref:Protein RER1 n=1 Tax=Kwoniella mangroviensis CBS 10435 TaxID=1331196 RepID=A0A1B9IYN2_9TREE|nr:hypothetical protein L486_00276 [Kwoniella mangroviensis CBS 10435]OCF74611.1 hypothetical protein I204_04990 [Kwoniella mangroviensis CBS 8886]
MNFQNGPSYPAVNPYPASGAAPPPGPGQSPAQGGANNGPVGGPGSGFPPRSGLAGMQPNSYSSAPIPNLTPGSGIRGGLPEEKNVAQLVKENTNVYARKFQALLDRSTPHVMERWLVTLGLFLLFVLNVILRQGWYIVCYALAIYLLNLFLAFLQPRFDPSIAEDLAADDVEEGAPGLPGAHENKPTTPGGLKGLMSGFSNGGDDEEFRPFIRRLPEFKFWYSATKATGLALLSTITRATDVPVYWPILVIYFLTLFGLTMRRQIQHMIKYKYVPFDLGKKTRYGKK